MVHKCSQVFSQRGDLHHGAHSVCQSVKLTQLVLLLLMQVKCWKEIHNLLVKEENRNGGIRTGLCAYFPPCSAQIHSQVLFESLLTEFGEKKQQKKNPKDSACSRQKKTKPGRVWNAFDERLVWKACSPFLTHCRAVTSTCECFVWLLPISLSKSSLHFRFVLIQLALKIIFLKKGYVLRAANWVLTSPRSRHLRSSGLPSQLHLVWKLTCFRCKWKVLGRGWIRCV